jgi:hypothetical protein
MICTRLVTGGAAALVVTMPTSTAADLEAAGASSDSKMALEKKEGT